MSDDSNLPKAPAQSTAPTKRKIHRSGQGSVGNYVCIKKGDVVKRVLRAAGDAAVRGDGFSYVPRKVWKTEIRDKGLAVKFVELPKKERKEKKKKVNKQVEKSSGT